MTIKQRILDEDFVINVRPQMDKDFVWTGEVDISIMTAENNPLDDHDYYGVLDFCRTMCATVPLMERDEDLRQRAIKEAIKYEDVPEKKKAKVVDKHDNVVVLSFDADTDGNA